MTTEEMDLIPKLVDKLTTDYGALWDAAQTAIYHCKTWGIDSEQFIAAWEEFEKVVASQPNVKKGEA